MYECRLNKCLIMHYLIIPRDKHAAVYSS